MSTQKLKSKEDLKKLRKSGEILSHILKRLKKLSKPGLELKKLDQKAEKLIEESEAQSVFLGYKPAGASKPYPAHICTSLNEEVVHGIPDERILKEGDLLKIDLGIKYEGLITDSAITAGIGSLSEDAKKLSDTTKKALNKALEICRPGAYTGEIGEVIEEFVSDQGFKIIKNLTGHGVGFKLHEKPTILNYKTKNKGVEMVEGMVIAIEPMISMGSNFAIQQEDGSYITSDGSLSAHFEATVAIAENGKEILSPTLDL